MTLRISTSTASGTRRIRVEGRLTGAALGELEHAIGDDPEAARLELDDLRSADAAALALLRRLRVEGVAMEGVPPHLAWRIEDG